MNILKLLIKSKAFPYALLFIALYFGYCYITSLQNENKLLFDSKNKLTLQIDEKNNQLNNLQIQNDNNQLAHIEQKQALQDAEQQSRQYKQQIEKLKNENKDLKNWFNTVLPNDIKRLYGRPEIKGSTDYKIWLSSRHILPPSGK